MTGPDNGRRRQAVLTWAGLGLTACVSLAALLGPPAAVQFVAVSFLGLDPGVAKLLAAAALAAAIIVRALADRRCGEGSLRGTAILALVAGSMTTWHWLEVDAAQRQVPVPGGGWSTFHPQDWQKETYLNVLSRRREDPATGSASVPHVFRPLPYGFVRSLELVTGDWAFSCQAYRWFFNYWFLWAYVGFVRRFHTPAQAWLSLAPLAVLYPMSLWYYQGQLTDPMSHALFALGLCYTVDRRPLALAVALVLGVMAKETAVVLLPAYLACDPGDRRRWLETAGAAAAAGVAYFAARVPVGWGPNFESINGTAGLMVTSNLGLRDAPYRLKPGMLLRNYLHPIVFIGSFLPFIAWHWRQADRRLRVLFLVLTPLLLLSNLSFGWMYESRNYVPLLPVLTALALRPTKPKPAAPPLRGGNGPAGL